MEEETVASMDDLSSMNSYSEPLGIVSILRESFKILLRSGRLAASTTIMTLVPNSLLCLSNILSIKLLLFDLFSNSQLLNTTDPLAMDFFELVLCIKEDIQVLSGVKLIFFLTYSVVTLFSLLALLLSSTEFYSSKNFDLKELISKIGRTWAMPLITWAYITLMGVGYTLLLVGLIGLLALISDGIAAMVFAGGVLIILSISLFLHSAVVWMSGLVIFVVEESCYGTETVERSKEFMNGETLQWLVLNLLSMVTGYVMLIAFQLLKVNETLLALFIVGLVTVNVVCLMKVFSLMAYMVFYYQFKRRYGDELEFQLQMGYINLIDVLV